MTLEVGAVALGWHWTLISEVTGRPSEPPWYILCPLLALVTSLLVWARAKWARGLVFPTAYLTGLFIGSTARLLDPYWLGIPSVVVLVVTATFWVAACGYALGQDARPLTLLPSVAVAAVAVAVVLGGCALAAGTVDEPSFWVERHWSIYVAAPLAAAFALFVSMMPALQSAKVSTGPRRLEWYGAFGWSIAPVTCYQYLFALLWSINV
ncbi:MAG: Bax inhibitor-1/YccA family protein [Acidimicrobiia bacterium]|nr:Bax inhibitor-1/YccA family protein [Acidimicrobiia bacterium]